MGHYFQEHEEQKEINVDTSTGEILNGATSAPNAADMPSPIYDLESANRLLEKAHPALKEWFNGLCNHENFPSIKEHVKVTESGIEVPITLLGKFGLSGPKVQQLLQAAELIVGRSADGRAQILNMGLKPFLLGVE